MELLFFFFYQHKGEVASLPPLPETKTSNIVLGHFRFREDGVVKYLDGAKELKNEERNTMEVSFEDVEKYNQNLSATIIEEYFR